MLINIRPEAELDIAIGYDWYEAELPGLGIEFIEALEEAISRIAADPLHYDVSRSWYSPKTAKEISLRRVLPF